MKKNSEVIQDVIDLLSVREHWTKWAMARSIPDGGTLGIDGYHTSVNCYVCSESSEQARSWCLSGALVRNTFGQRNRSFNDSEHIDQYYSVWRVFDRLAKDRGFAGGVPFNNHQDTTHEDLMILLKEALYDAQANEARKMIGGVA